MTVEKLKATQGLGSITGWWNVTNVLMELGYMELNSRKSFQFLIFVFRK